MDEASEIPRVLKLLDDTLKIQKVLAQKDEVLKDDIKEKKEDAGSHWYTEACLGEDQASVDIFKVVPCLLYMAYDAFVTDVSVVVLYERIVLVMDVPLQSEIQDMWNGVLAFLRAAMTHDTLTTTSKIDDVKIITLFLDVQ